MQIEPLRVTPMGNLDFIEAAGDYIYTFLAVTCEKDVSFFINGGGSNENQVQVAGADIRQMFQMAGTIAANAPPANDPRQRLRPRRGEQAPRRTSDGYEKIFLDFDTIYNFSKATGAYCIFCNMPITILRMCGVCKTIFCRDCRMKVKRMNGNRCSQCKGDFEECIWRGNKNHAARAMSNLLEYTMEGIESFYQKPTKIKPLLER